MKDTDDDPFRPLSAKSAGKDIGPDGRERQGKRGRGGDVNKLRNLVARRQKDAARRVKGAS